MRKYTIQKPDEEIIPFLRKKIDNLTKPKGSLGMLEELALQVGWIQQTLEPSLKRPTHIVFAGDHGVAEENISLSPQEITYQMILNFWKGGAGINFLVRQHGFDFVVVDGGVNHDFAPDDPIIDRKIRKGTRNYLYGPAMTEEECSAALDIGAQCVEEVFNNGCNVISFGEIGITNTSSSALWMCALAGISLEQCVGPGSDHSGNIVAHKLDVLGRSLANYSGDGSVFDVMRWFGGYEMVMTVGGMLRAASLGMVILIDGFIMTNCLLAASRVCPEVMHYAVFGHQGDENGHKTLLEYLGGKPLLQLGLRLGEGTGAICAYPILESAVRMINEMASFEAVRVTKYFK